MKRSISSLLIAALLPLGAAAAVLSTSSDAHAQRRWGAPPPSYVARYHPVYYNGYAHYYYNGRWGYYRPGQGWYYYEHNPAYFCTYRDRAYGWNGC
ncbi:MAG TPA: hypothetical protein VGG39_20460 [Polyangiaceae bacterium]|jgi:hypothetical protein